MIAILVFLFVSAAMLGILAVASELYRRGEASRTANDEAMAVLNLLDRDLAAAVHPDQLGQFWAKPLGPAGNCQVGWTIEDQASDSGYSFVVWGVDGVVPDAELRRARYEEVVPGEIGTYPDDTDIEGMTGGDVTVRPITIGILHFGVWLAGTGTGGGDEWTLPADGFWTQIQRDPPTGPVKATEPVIDPQPYTTFRGMRYPHAIRITLMLTGGGRFAPRGRVVADDGQLVLRVRGLGRVPTLRGSLARIGDELVGFHGVAGDRLLVNEDSNDGPLDPATLRGRRVYRSADPGGGHAPKTRVYLGHQYGMVRIIARR